MSMAIPKIILHSDQSVVLTSQIDRELLHSLSGKRAPRIGYIPSIPDPRRKYFGEKAAYYAKVGFPGLVYFDPEEIYEERDIRLFFDVDIIHLSGGEVVPFVRRLRETGCDARLRAFAARGGVLLGVSAGAMLLGRSFSSAALSGDRGPFDGLGFFDFEIVPHVAEEFPRLDVLKNFAIAKKKTLYALNDGDVVTVQGTKIRTYGAAVRFGPLE